MERPLVLKEAEAVVLRVCGPTPEPFHEVDWHMFELQTDEQLRIEREVKQKITRLEQLQQTAERLDGKGYYQLFVPAITSESQLFHFAPHLSQAIHAMIESQLAYLGYDWTSVSDKLQAQETECISSPDQHDVLSQKLS